jgi:lipopolysaccharide transport system ATP-binding protein
MSGVVIRAVNLSKQYRIGHVRPGNKTFKELVTDKLSTPFRRAGNLLRGQGTGGAETHETLWVLRGVSFDVKRGEVFGIIGRNGSGKTTILKILSMITEPSEGYAEFEGRIGSLLEVGTGFHLELTGRENVYLSGAILGMKKAEIDRKFDEIVSFAETEKFVDTPVKHYSSGMYIRLTFAVAAHLDPEILLIDEVLAVGDLAFQKKCLGRMEEIASGGRTVVFVSHDMTAVLSLCSRCLLLDNGKVDVIGPTDPVVQRYRSLADDQTRRSLKERKDRQGNGPLRFTSLRFAGPDVMKNQASMVSGQSASIILQCHTENGEALKDAAIAIAVSDVFGRPLFALETQLFDMIDNTFSHVSEIVCSIPNLPLLPGVYGVKLWSEIGGQESDVIENAGDFIVKGADSPTRHLSANHRRSKSHHHGFILVPHSWQILPKKTLSNG